LYKFCATFWQNFAAVSYRDSRFALMPVFAKIASRFFNAQTLQKILPKNEPKFGQKRNVVGLKTGSINNPYFLFDL